MRVLTASLLTVLVFVFWWRPANGEDNILRVYCGNHPAAPRFHGNGLPFELRGLHYVLTARHVVMREEPEQTFNYSWLGRSPNSLDPLTYHWGDKDLDIAVLEKSDQSTYWTDETKADWRLPPADSILLQRLATQGTSGEIRCVIEGSDLSPIPIVLLSRSGSRAEQVNVRVADTTQYTLSRGMSGGLVYVQNSLFGVLTATDTVGGTAIVKRWDYVRKEALEYLNDIPIQICLREWEAKNKLNRWLKIGTGAGMLAAGGLALWSHMKADDKYDEYLDAIDPDIIQSRWDDYRGHIRRRNVGIAAAAVLTLFEGLWFLKSPDRPTIDGECVQRQSQIGGVGLRVTSESVALAFSW